MAKFDAKYLLKEPKGDKPTEIRLFSRFDNERLVYTIKEQGTKRTFKIHPELWDFSTQRPIDKKSLPKKTQPKDIENNRNIKLQIEKVDSAFSEIKDQARANNITLTKEYLTQVLNEKLGFEEKKIQSSDTINMTSYIELVIKEMEAGQRLDDKKKTKYTKGSIKSFKNFQTHWLQFHIWNGANIDFEDIDREIYNDFLEFLMSPIENTNDGYSKIAFKQNTVGKQIKHLKTILNWGLDENLHSNVEQKKKYFSKPYDETFGIYLNEGEIKKIYNTTFEGGKSSVRCPLVPNLN